MAMSRRFLATLASIGVRGAEAEGKETALCPSTMDGHAGSFYGSPRTADRAADRGRAGAGRRARPAAHGAPRARGPSDPARGRDRAAAQEPRDHVEATHRRAR